MEARWTLWFPTFAPPRSAPLEKESTAEGWIGRAVLPANIALEKASRVSVASLSLIWIGLVGLADYWTGYEWSMLIFYLIPITLWNLVHGPQLWECSCPA